MFNDEYKPSLDFERMKAIDADAWVHEHAYILPNGKVIDPTVTEGAVDRMRTINEDEGYKVKEGEGEEVNEVDMKYWKLKVIGDQMLYTKGDDTVSHAIVLIQNERWPGTKTVWKNGECPQ